MSQRDRQLKERGGAPIPGVRIRGTARGKPIETEVADVRRLPEDYPFKIGDLVKLKSGGAEMTVIDIIDTCAEKGAIVEVVWSSPHFDHRLWRDKLPWQCLVGQDNSELPF